jgi:protein-disulfide isomerase
MIGREVTMSSLRLVVLPFVVYAALAMGANAQTAPSANEGNENQETEKALLRELAAIREEIQSLRMEVSDLSDQVADIHRVAVRPSAPPPPESVNLDENRALGSADATVAIVEFSDYQCPYCERFFSQTFSKLEEDYIETGKVRFYFRDFPLTQIHPQAKSAAIAANCAGRQGGYWKMHHELFTNQAELGPELYKELAQKLQLDVPEFETCLAAPDESQKVDDDLAYGQTLTVQGTPHYFVGRVQDGQLVNILRVNGAQPYELFSKVLESMLQ